MEQEKNDMSSQQDKSLTTADDRIQLLDTIKEMVKTEVDKRISEKPCTEEGNNPHPEKPPPRRPRERSLSWQGIRDFIYELLF
jgi:hypothetical protein